MKRIVLILFSVFYFVNCNNINEVYICNSKILRYQNTYKYDKTFSFENSQQNFGVGIDCYSIDFKSLNKILNSHIEISDRKIIKELLNFDIISGWDGDESLDKAKYLYDIGANTQFFILNNSQINKNYNSINILSRYTFMNSEFNIVYRINYKQNKIISIVQISSFLNFDDIVILGSTKHIDSKYRYSEQHVTISEYNNDQLSNLKDTVYYSDYYIDKYGRISE